MGRVKGSGEGPSFLLSSLHLPWELLFLLSPIFHCHKIKDGGYNNITNTNKVSPTQNTPALQAKISVIRPGIWLHNCPSRDFAQKAIYSLPNRPRPLSSFDTHARSARSRWPYGKIEDWEQSTSNAIQMNSGNVKNTPRDFDDIRLH